ncbi:Kelch repeat type 1-containing protein [Ruminiclostridium papyrosolvens DSM 2782]|uniref:Kelch repeat type 1-containing protein n=1 Tax=Ruminiclostridium papyrosolvens DSM 2782 TaxID=588581 RepID=F1TBL8_9FIRM|nr:hypothetical protein [Ruminiclostridium papyrosolvens]EGD48422.1 Kelch repeat type 1-containing protein [Ruminiclostridium papyrosolvens DSM 2782]WES34074.1 hypothetical protein P0092_20310 [Ruminiclostridium papyrosolvens DSM 2782]
MAVNTANYNLKKPSQEDFYNIEDHNGNMDIIDTQIKRVETELEGHVGDTQSHVPHLGTTVNNGNTYTIDSEKTISDGSKFSVKFNAIATGPATLSISSDELARSLKKPSGEDFKPKAGIYSFIRDGENFQLLGEGGEYGNVTAPKVLKGFTFGTENGLEVGTLDIPEEGWWNPHGQWYNCADYETTTFWKDIGSCVCDEKLYYIATFSMSETLKTKMYNPTTNVWSDETPPPVPIVYHSYVLGVFNHKIYWYTNSQPTSTTDIIYIYDTIAKTWSNITAKTPTMKGPSCRWVMSDENTFYNIGGDNSYEVWLYNKSLDTVTIKGHAPVFLAYSGMVYNPNNNSIYCFGTNVYSGATKTYVYNCTTNTWTQLASMFSNDSWIYFSAIIKDSNNILVGGGSKYSYAMSTILYNYDITLNSYSVHLIPPSQKSCGSIALVNNKLYWFGGYNYPSITPNTFAYFY